MSIGVVTTRLFRFFLLAAFLSPAVSFAQQNLAEPLIVQPLDETKLTVLKGNTHMLAQPQYDQGAALASLPMEHMLLVLKRSAAQEFALRKTLDDQQDKFSPSYHQWATPEQFGKQFGISDNDLQTVTNWLQGHGFQVDQVTKGRTVIEFSGTAGQVQEALHTSIHKYLVNGEEHWANASDPQIPAALAPAVAGVLTLHNFLKKPQLHFSGEQAAFKPGPPPQVTFSDGTHALGPNDYGLIYNINPLYQQGITGTGATIAVVARSNIDIEDVVYFDGLFGISAFPHVINNGLPPGDLGGGEEAEAVLDLTWAGAIAPGAVIDQVLSASTNTTDGVDLSELYVIENNLADVMTESFGSCEAGYTSTDAAGVAALAEQAAAQGITYTVSTGDSGAEGCDNPNTENTASGPVSVSVLASSPFNIAVGGTMFNENGQNAKYWGPSTGGLAETALSYIPENVWNEQGLWAGGGGVSTFFAKPSWQPTSLQGVPNDSKRDLPDVSLTAAGHDPYLICLAGGCQAGFINFVSGTSAAAPSFAGMMALVRQKTGSRQGQANYVLYRLAQAETFSQCNGSKTTALPAGTCVFNDVTVGNNAVPGEVGSSYVSTAGYDLASGLGSVNAANMVNNWNTVTFNPTTTTLSITPLTITHGAPVNVSVAVARSSGTGTPGGDVSLLTNLNPSGEAMTSLPLSGGAVSSTVHTLPGGGYSVTAHYAGDAAFAASDSAPVAVTVTAESSSTALSVFGFDSTGNLIPYTSQPYGSPAYLRADVSGSSGYGTPTGVVTFNLPNSGGNLDSLGTVTTAQGIFTLAGGTHSVVASYGGDNGFHSSSSTPVNVTVTPALTTTALTSNGNSFGEGAAVTFSVTLNMNSYGAHPTGTVTFLSNGTPISSGPATVFGNDGNGNVQNGVFQAAQASANTTTVLPDGQNSVIAQYSGDANYAASTSAAIIINVQADFTPSLAPSQLTVSSPGGSATTTLTITGQTGYSGTINFTPASCTGLPLESACSFTPASITGSGTTQLTVTTTGPHARATRIAGITGGSLWWFGAGTPMLAGIFLLGVPSKRTRWTRVLAFAVFTFLVLLPACGGGSPGGGGGGRDTGTPKGAHSVNVTAMSSSAISHPVSFTLIVN
jgi:hypothetical protein